MIQGTVDSVRLEAVVSDITSNTLPNCREDFELPPLFGAMGNHVVTVRKVIFNFRRRGNLMEEDRRSRKADITKRLMDNATKRPRQRNGDEKLVSGSRT